METIVSWRISTQYAQYSLVTEEAVANIEKSLTHLAISDNFSPIKCQQWFKFALV